MSLQSASVREELDFSTEAICQTFEFGTREERHQIRRLLEQGIPYIGHGAASGSAEAVFGARKAIEAFLHDTALFLPRNDALKVLEGHDLHAFACRPRLVEQLAHPFVPLYTLPELAERTAGFIAHLERNREHLLLTGFSRTGFARCEWLQIRLGNLYYTYEPISWRARAGAAREWIYEYAWTADADAEAPFSAATTPIRDGYEPIAEDVRVRLASLRAIVHDAKIAILRLLLTVMHDRDTHDLRERSRELLVRSLSPGDKDFLLRADDYYLRLPSGEPAFSSARGYGAGGLSDLLDVIGHYEREIELGRLAHTRERLFGFMSTDDHGRFSMSRNLYSETEEIALLETALATYLSRTVAHAARVTDYRLWRDRTLNEGWAPAAEPKRTPFECQNQSTAENVFRRERNKWIVAFNGRRSVEVPDPMRGPNAGQGYAGFRTVAYLLSKPHVRISAYELDNYEIAVAVATDHSQHVSLTEAIDAGLSTSRASGEQGKLPDDQAVSDYRKRLAALQTSVEGASKELAAAQTDPKRMQTGRVIRLQKQITEWEEEISLLKREIGRAVGQGGQLRSIDGERETVRLRVRGRIERVRKRLEECDPVLGKHLRDHIITTDGFKYAPPLPVDWQL